MKHRIRVVVDQDASSDGQPAKAWLQYDTSAEKTIKECRRAFAKQLGLRNADELELVIEGFKVLDSLSSDTLDATKDVVEIHRKPQASLNTTREGSHTAKRRKLTPAARTDILPKRLVQQTVQAQPSTSLAASTSTQAPPKQLPSAPVKDGYESDSSSSSSSSSASSSSSSSASSSSASSSSSSSSPSSSNSSSSSSSTDSASSSSSGKYPSKSNALHANAKETNQSASDQSGVPPGQGKATTKARNARKRLRKQHMKRAATDVEDATGIKRPKISQAVKLARPDNPELSKIPTGDPTLDFTSMSTTTLLPASGNKALPQASTSKTVIISAPAPMSESKGEDLKMLSLASGNSKKAKSLRRDMLVGRRQTNKKIVYADGEAMSMDVTPDSSAILAELTDVNGDASVPAIAASSSSILAPQQRAQKPVDFFPNGVNKRLPPPPPSTRSDLPSNVIVTSVDVEAEDFIPGVPTPGFVAPPQVPYYAQAQVCKPSPKASQPANAVAKAVPDTSDYFNAYSGYYGATSHNTKGNKQKATGQNKPLNGETVAANVERYVSNLDSKGWPGWPSLEDLEGGLFETYKPVTAPGDSEKVAVKILELSPSSFMPSLSLYHGIVLSLESSPHSSAIRLKLHPSCRPGAGVEVEEDMEDEIAYDETEFEPQYPKFFGEDLETPLADVDHPDVRLIKLDDIVDCRRIVLS